MKGTFHEACTIRKGILNLEPIEIMKCENNRVFLLLPCYALKTK